MPYNSAVHITIDDVETQSDRVKFINQECVSSGLSATLYSYVAGVVGIPLFLKTIRAPIGTEYKMAIGTIASVAISYYAGTYVKRKCEEDIKRQLDEKLNC